MSLAKHGGRATMLPEQAWPSCQQNHKSDKNHKEKYLYLKLCLLYYANLKDLNSVTKQAKMSCLGNEPSGIPSTSTTSAKAKASSSNISILEHVRAVFCMPSNVLHGMWRTTQFENDLVKLRNNLVLLQEHKAASKQVEPDLVRACKRLADGAHTSRRLEGFLLGFTRGLQAEQAEQAEQLKELKQLVEIELYAVQPAKHALSERNLAMQMTMLPAVVIATAASSLSAIAKFNVLYVVGVSNLLNLTRLSTMRSAS